MMIYCALIRSLNVVDTPLILEPVYIVIYMCVGLFTVIYRYIIVIYLIKSLKQNNIQTRFIEKNKRKLPYNNIQW